MNCIPPLWRNTAKRTTLMAVICNKCKSISHATRCEKCNSTDTNQIELSGKATIISFTNVHDAPDKFKKATPYTLALVKLSEGPNMVAQIVDSDNISIGAEVESCLRKAHADGAAGLISYSLKFKVI